MTGPPQFNILQAIITYILGDSNSFKAVLLRIISIIVAILSYFSIHYSDDIATYFKDAPRKEIMSEIISKREENYPQFVEERLQMLYSAIRPDSIAIFEFKPQFSNDYVRSLGYKGKKLPINDGGFIALNKGSLMYRVNILGEPFTTVLGDKGESLAKEPKLVVPRYLFEGIKYIFTYPIFDLDNSYSGCIVIGWDTPPQDFSDPEFTRQIRLIVLPSARALGRAK